MPFVDKNNRTMVPVRKPIEMSGNSVVWDNQINKVKKSIQEALNYIVNPDKTDGGCLVSSYACSSDINIALKDFEMINKFALRNRKDGVIARHIKQSFSPEDDITPEKAHKIGLEFCKKIFNDEYQYIISTHTDKVHLHNHIIFNTTNIKTHKKYRSNKKTYKELQKTSDKICSEYNISVIPPKMSKEKGKKYKEWEEDRKGKSFKSILKKDIDTCIKISSNYEEFKANMQKIGYEIKDYNSKGEYLKYISFKNESIGMIKFIRGRDTLLGEKYTRENIQLGIKSKALNIIKENDKIKLGNIIDTNKNEKARTIETYKKFASKKNIDTLAKTKSYMKSNDIKTLEELKKYNQDAYIKFKNLQSELSIKQANLNNINLIINAYEAYQNNLNIYREYVSIKDEKSKKLFFINHKNEIKDFINSKEILTKNFPDKVIPKLEHLKNKKQDIENELQESIKTLSQMEKEYKKSKLAQKICKAY